VNNTIATYARSVHAFCSWLIVQGYLKQTPFAQVKMPKMTRRRLHLIEPETFERLLHACHAAGAKRATMDHATVRNRALLWVLWDTGLLVSEVCALDLEDVDLPQSTLHIRGTGSRRRSLPLTPQVQQALAVDELALRTSILLPQCCVICLPFGFSRQTEHQKHSRGSWVWRRVPRSSVIRMPLDRFLTGFQRQENSTHQKMSFDGVCCPFEDSENAGHAPMKRQRVIRLAVGWTKTQGAPIRKRFGEHPLFPPRVIVPYHTTNISFLGYANNRERLASLVSVRFHHKKMEVKIVLVGVITHGGMRVKLCIIRR
jgi:hypothetical protein